MPPTFSILNLITVILSITTFQTVNLTGSNCITPILISLYWRRVNKHIVTSFFLSQIQSRYYHGTQPTYLHNLISRQPSRITHSSSVVTFSRNQPSPPWKSQIAYLDRPICITSSLESTSRLTSSASPVLSWFTSSRNFIKTHLWHHHHSQHPLLLHSFTTGSKPTFSTNPSPPDRLLLPPDCLHR